MWSVVISTSVVYFLYVFLGGGIFSLLEYMDLFDIKTIPKPNRSRTVNFTELRDVLLSNNHSNLSINAVVKAWSIKKSFLNNGTEDVQYVEAREWTFDNAFFFSLHLCATIGYGDTTPKTANGQLLACIYCIFGVPLNVLLMKLIAESFAQSFDEIMARIKGDEDTLKKRILADLAFFLPWTLTFLLLPAIVFMFTESWNMIEGIYFSFITITTVGLGDYVAGYGVLDATYHVFYKLFILLWMIYGLAFATLITDYLSYIYQVNCLFEVSCLWGKCRPVFKRTYIDVEKMDIHFRLLRSMGARNKYGIWTTRRAAILSHDSKVRHLANLAILAEKMQGEVLTLIHEFETSDDITTDKKIPVDAFPVRSRKE